MLGESSAPHPSIHPSCTNRKIFLHNYDSETVESIGSRLTYRIWNAFTHAIDADLLAAKQRRAKKKKNRKRASTTTQPSNSQDNHTHSRDSDGTTTIIPERKTEDVTVQESSSNDGKSIDDAIVESVAESSAVSEEPNKKRPSHRTLTIASLNVRYHVDIQYGADSVR